MLYDARQPSGAGSSAQLRKERRVTAVVGDYDFRLGKSHLRGKGWRGLVALGFVMTPRAATIGVLAVAAKPAGVWLLQHLQQILGT
jgi:hypothetical protein